MVTYKDAGVNLELGDDASKIFYNAAKLTWKNREGKLGEVIEASHDFSGLRAIHVGELPKGTFMNIGFDGVGTKMEVAERIRDHRTIAYDLFAMVCDDAVVRGAEPVLVGSILDVNSLEGNIEVIKQLADGYVNAAKEANVAVVNGEVAELGARVQGYREFNYNWGAAVVWFANSHRLISGNEIRAGDSLVALKEEGFRSNGLSLVRKIVEFKFGSKWHEIEWEDGKTLGNMVLTPSRIYTRAVVDMFGGWDLEREPKAKVHGVAHITGGGIPGKLGRILKPSGLGAFVEPRNPPKFIDYIRYLGKVSGKEAYRTWNMGQGMIIITPEPEKVIRVASSHGIEAYWAGEIVDKLGIRIKNNGKSSKRKYLDFY